MARRKTADRDAWYIDPVQLGQDVADMQKKGEVTEQFAKHLLTIQEKVMQFPRFRYYPEEIKEELRSYNQYRWIMKGWKSIDAEKNCFAYITQGTCLNFLQALTKYFRDFNNRIKLMKEMYEEKGIPWEESGYEQADKMMTLHGGTYENTEY